MLAGVILNADTRNGRHKDFFNSKHEGLNKSRASKQTHVYNDVLSTANGLGASTACADA